MFATQFYEYFSFSDTKVDTRLKIAIDYRRERIVDNETILKCYILEVMLIFHCF